MVQKIMTSNLDDTSFSCKNASDGTVTVDSIKKNSSCSLVNDQYVDLMFHFIKRSYSYNGPKQFVKKSQRTFSIIKKTNSQNDIVPTFSDLRHKNAMQTVTQLHKNSNNKNEGDKKNKFETKDIKQNVETDLENINQHNFTNIDEENDNSKKENDENAYNIDIIDSKDSKNSKQEKYECTRIQKQYSLDEVKLQKDCANKNFVFDKEDERDTNIPSEADCHKEHHSHQHQHYHVHHHHSRIHHSINIKQKEDRYKKTFSHAKDRKFTCDSLYIQEDSQYNKDNGNYSLKPKNDSRRRMYSPNAALKLEDDEKVFLRNSLSNGNHALECSMIILNERIDTLDKKVKQKWRMFGNRKRVKKLNEAKQDLENVQLLYDKLNSQE